MLGFADLRRGAVAVDDLAMLALVGWLDRCL